VQETGFKIVKVAALLSQRNFTSDIWKTFGKSRLACMGNWSKTYPATIRPMVQAGKD
jgi:hypothetical protein